MNAIAQSLDQPVSSENFAARGCCGSPVSNTENPWKSTKSEKAVWENMPMTTTVERKYALTKIAAGDYLLPSNDAQTIWRIHRYTDGVSGGLDFPDRDFWSVWRWTGPMHGAVDFTDWDHWDHMTGLCDTRADAISEALRLT